MGHCVRALQRGERRLELAEIPAMEAIVLCAIDASRLYNIPITIKQLARAGGTFVPARRDDILPSCHI